MANIYDVARRASVSVATVSAVFNKSSYVSPALEEKVQRAIRELNYTPNLLARSMAKQQTLTLGVLIPDAANPFFPEIVRGIEDCANAAGYSILLGSSDNQTPKEEIYLRLFLSKRVDGILLVKAPGGLSTDLLASLRRNAPPVVLVDREYPALRADTVVADDFGGGFAATKHLLDLGHRRIGLVRGISGTSTSDGRLRGYEEALGSKRIACDDSLIVEGDYGIDSGYAAGLKLLAQRPTAVVVTNYLMTIGFLKAMEELGLACPRDVSIVSYDDFVWNDVFPPKLTSIVQPKYAIGHTSAEILLARIAGKHKRPKFQELPNGLHVRDSTAPLKKIAAPKKSRKTGKK
ncbi:MAG TPA: LacI family DNA-binding transcriptional regulator [Acidobacteriaceae bacterium]|nr:LacI family DNA-binding transcriptional regulator [Acidobacteriaceae bacterium]